MENAKIFSGRAHPEIAKQIANKLNIELGKISIANFPDGEIYVQVEESVRGKDTFIIQPFAYPPNDNIMELLIIVDALRRASAKTITVVIPYFGYARQSQKTTGREPISCKLVMNLLATTGIDRVVSVDLHKPQIQAFIDKPFDHLSACALISNYFRQKNLVNPIIVAPDLGKAKLAEKYSSFLGYPMMIMYKKKDKDKKGITFGGVIGDPKGTTPIIIDDMIANGTAVKQALALLDDGCRPEIYFAITHPILIGDSLQKLSHPAIKEVVVTDSLPVEDKKQKLSKITILHLADLLSEVIYRIQHKMSISEVFQKQKLDIPI